MSFPQCGTQLPVNLATFAVVGVNDGVPGTLNSCFSPDPSFTQSQLYWMVELSNAAPGQPKPALYVNSDDPGSSSSNRRGLAWPGSGSTPVGVCSGGASVPCAWQYGNDAAHADVSYLEAAVGGINSQNAPITVSARPGDYSWWIDVETANSWRSWPSGVQLNVAVLWGMLAGLQGSGANDIGIYSTRQQWALIAGGGPPTGALNTLPTWTPGFSSQADAAAACQMLSFNSGKLEMTQWTAGMDGDVAC